MFLCESGRVDERVKNTLLQNKQDGGLTGSRSDGGGIWEVAAFRRGTLHRAGGPSGGDDGISAHLPPSLGTPGAAGNDGAAASSYGGSLETAVTDLEHYRGSGSAVLVLCGGESRANNLQRLLEERRIPAVLDLKNAGMPEPGEVRISMGALSAGCEWPTIHLAVLTEGQLTGTVRKRAKLKRRAAARKSSPIQTSHLGTWWFMFTMAWAGLPASSGCRWTGWRRTILKLITLAATVSMSR